MFGGHFNLGVILRKYNFFYYLFTNNA
jgi:hypothetical protein